MEDRGSNMYDVEGILPIFQIYAGPTIFLPLFLVCLIYSFCNAQETGRKRFALIFIMSIVFVFNDFSIKLAGKVTDVATYYRFLWAIPILPLIGWAGTKAVMEREKRWEKAIALALVCCLFFGWQSSFITEGSIRVPDNLYNLSEDVIQVCDIIAQDKEKENPIVIFDMECQMSARIYDPSLVWGIRRKAYQYHNDMEGYEEAGNYKTDKIMIHAVNFGVKDEQEELSNALKKKKVDYIVTLTAFEMDAYLDEIGYELVDVSGTRSVYTRKK